MTDLFCWMLELYLQLENIKMKILFDDSKQEEVVDAVYGALSITLDFAEVLLYEDELDKHVLINTAYLQCENMGVKLDSKIKSVINSGVTLIYIFMSR